MFTFLVLFAAFLIESIGTYVSVVGLSALFSSNPVIILLAVSLDIGKVVTVSFLYRNWKDINWLMKTYMTIAALVLMLITSVGAFGYLSAEFQKAIQGTNENAVVIESMQAEQARLQARKEQIDNQIAQFPPEFVTGRRQAVEQFAPEVNRINNRLAEIDAQLPELKLETIKKNVEVGPIIFIAEAFGTTPEEAVKYVIMIIIFVFDPLAIALLIAGNFLIKNKELLKIKKQKEDQEAKMALQASTPAVPVYDIDNLVSRITTENNQPLASVPDENVRVTKGNAAYAATIAEPIETYEPVIEPLTNLEDIEAMDDDVEPRIESGGVTAEIDGDETADIDVDDQSEEAKDALLRLQENQTRPHLKLEKLADNREVITKDQLITKRAKSQLEDIGFSSSGADVYDDDVRPAEAAIRNRYLTD